jgi:hypothetical protein
VTAISPEVRARILNNARAAEWERLRNEARLLWPDLDEPTLNEKARELQREKLTAAGRKGAETYRQRAEAQRAFEQQRDDIIADLQQILERLRTTGRAA